MTSKWQQPTFRPNRRTSAWTKSAHNQRRYASSSFRSTSSNAPSTYKRTDKHLASLERYLLVLTKKAPTTTRHVSRLWILSRHQFYQRPPPRAHQQDQHRRNLPNTRIIYSNTKKYIRQHKKKKNKYNKYQAGLTALRNLITINIGESFVLSYNNSITGFHLSILSSSWNTSEPTMKMSSQNNYKRMGFHWIHNGTQLLPLKCYSLTLKTTNYSSKMDKIHSLRKISFTLNTLPSKTLDCSSCHVIPGETIPKAPKIGVTSSSYLPKMQPISNITPLAQSDSMTNLTMLSYNW